MFKKQSLKKNIKKSKNVKELLNNIINIALKYKANNIHLEPHGYHYHIRYRINKELKKVGRMPFALGESIITHLQKIKDKNDNFTLEVTPKKSVHINTNIFPTIFGTKATLHFIKQDGLGLSSLKLNSEQLETITNNLLSDKGLILLTGFKPLEKNKILYALMHHLLESRNLNIFTIEDYIDYPLPNVKQKVLENFNDTSVFQNLQTITKKNPQAIMLSHIMGPNSARMVINSALLNNLILTYLPLEKEYYKTIPSLKHWGIDDYLIKSAIKLIIYPDNNTLDFQEF